MLVYEKKVDEERKLFGTMGNIPADEDAELTYKDADGAEITPIENDSYVDSKKGGIIRKSDNKEVYVFIDEQLIIPKDGEAPTPVDPQLEQIEWAEAPLKSEYIEGELLELDGAKINALYTDGSEVDVTADCTFTPADGDELAMGMTEIVAAYEDKEATQAISVREYVHGEATSDIDTKLFIAGNPEPVEFTFSTVAGDDAGIMVKGSSDFGVKYADALETLEYYEVKDGKWYDLKGHEFGGPGFPMADATSKFRAAFKADASGDYEFTAVVKKVEDDSILCSVNVAFTVLIA